MKHAFLVADETYRALLSPFHRVEKTPAKNKFPNEHGHVTPLCGERDGVRVPVDESVG